MKEPIKTAILFLAGFISTHSSAQKDKELLKKMEYEWIMAEFRLDTAFISQMMADEFISIGPGGISTKQEELTGIYNNMLQRKKDNHIVDSLHFEEVHIRIYKKTAVVTFITVTKGTKNKEPFANKRTRMYDVWVKRKGQWKAVSSQVTALK